MRSVFHCKLVNDVLEDPGVYVSVRHARRGMLFDLGQNDSLSSRELLALTDVFVTHCHIDHFVGFDRLLRVCLGREAHIRLYGPEGFIQHVASRLGGYLWNLAERYEVGLVLDVMEIREGGSGVRARFRLVDAFAPTAQAVVSLEDGVILDEEELRVRVAVLDHKTPCLGFSLEEKAHIGVKKNWLIERGLPIGKWLGAVKTAARAGLPDDTPFDLPTGGQATLGELRPCLVLSRGQRVAYLTDLAYTAQNLERATWLAQAADILFIEASFAAAEAERAHDRHHLTSWHAGWIARHVGAGRVVPFHFSPRHADAIDRLQAEVHDAWQGRVPIEPPPR